MTFAVNENPVKAIVHSQEEKGIQDVSLIRFVGDTSHAEVVTAWGVRCTAIFNVFRGCWYADDIYGILGD